MDVKKNMTNLKLKKMKKSIVVLFTVLVTGVFSGFAITNLQEGAEECCKTVCVDNKCCTEGAICKITGDENCKKKCCNTEKATCEVKQKSCETKNKKSCCNEKK